jgi:hypothetical protein
VFPVRYGLDLYMLIRRNLVFKVLINLFVGNCRLGCNAVEFSSALLSFQKEVLLLSSGSKSQPSKQPQPACSFFFTS